MYHMQIWKLTNYDISTLLLNKNNLCLKSPMWAPGLKDIPAPFPGRMS